MQTVAGEDSKWFHVNKICVNDQTEPSFLVPECQWAEKGSVEMNSKG